MSALSRWIAVGNEWTAIIGYGYATVKKDHTKSFLWKVVDSEKRCRASGYEITRSAAIRVAEATAYACYCIDYDYTQAVGT